MSERRFRIGILVDSLTVPRWQAHVLRRIKESGHDIVLAAVNDAPTANPFPLFYRVFAALDQRLFHAREDAFDRVSIVELLTSAKTFTAHPTRKKFSDTFTTDDLATIRDAKPDVLIRFGFRILRGDVLNVAPLGVWSYHHGDPDVKRGAPPAFWEVMEQEPVTGVVLQILSEDLDNGRILMRSWSRTDPVSPHRGKQQLYWKAAEFIPRVLVRLRSGESIEALMEPPRVGGYAGRLYTAPKNGEMVGLMVRHAWRLITYIWNEKLIRSHWFLLLGKTSVTDPVGSVWRYAPLRPPRGTNWADPFLFTHEGRQVLFIEEFSDAQPKGRIAVLTQKEDGSWNAPQPVLERPYHLSHPVVFAWQGSIYLMPESLRNGTLEVYRATRFPFEWELHTTVFTDIRLADATLHTDGERWWLSATVQPHPGASSWDELHLWHAPTPLGPWTAHPRNPVVSDVRCARPAGTPFLWNGSWIRPAQDGSGYYGSAIRLQRITKLTPEQYAEEPFGQLLPHWAPGLTGTHTINRVEGLTVIDAREKG